ncbi:MAG: lycopene beta-cyclase CrtY [Parasphingopyxis sp.]
MVASNSCDVAILGGGLAGGLIALELRRRRPEVRTLLIEEAEMLGGNHVWCFFSSDVDEAGRALLEPLIVHRWDGYEVRFPGYSRRLEARYNAIRSDRFDAAIREALPAEAIRTGARVIGASPGAVVLEGGERIEAGGVIDCRGAGDLSLLDLGWQKFAGVELRLEAPHGLERPVVMDATVEQTDGYRFMYLLPFAADRIFVEDTYYSDLPAMDAGAIGQRAVDYAEARGWKIAEIVHREKGVLPVACLGGAFGEYWRSGGKTAKAGLRAGLFHPMTGYSLPEAVRMAQRIAGLRDLSGAGLRDATIAHAAERWRAGRFYRMLASMLFRGAEPGERIRIFERFYSLAPALIERFYAGRSTLADKLRIVAGKPPIPVGRAIGAIVKGARA